jgi:predicted acyl esterase
MSKTIKRIPHKVKKIETVWIPMPDGVNLSATIWLPDDAEKNPVPAVLEFIPYRRRDFTASSGNQIVAERFTPSGMGIQTVSIFLTLCGIRFIVLLIIGDP